MAISEPKSAHLREVLLFAFNWKKSASEAHRMLEEVYSDHALSKSQCYRQFKKFQSGDFELDNEPHGKPPQKFEDAELQALLDEDSTQMQEKLAKQLQVSQEDNSKKWIVPIKVNNRQVIFKIDTGADVNVLPLQNYYQSFQRIKLEKSDKILQGPNGIPLETVGMIHVKLQNKGQHLNSKIYIVDKLKQPLLSGETSEKLNIVRMIQQLSSGGRGGQRGRLGSGDNRGCYNCGEEGHRKFECTKPARGGGRGRGQSRDGGSNNTCYNCGEVGHRKYECTNNPAEDGGQEENQPKSKKACYTCGEFGHKKDDGPKSGTQDSGDEEEVEAEEPPKKKSKKSKKKKIAI
ncbi:hypothetical protein LAZ67_6003904 [Cordylochernes scorpioides]|uniref:CCHC-type domain-containing protein n=1 Tax=Cordylochernes scorpioides TaxID=51811 RepID=A0ABY6KMV4_9ARAC|nr:hypothetical protein LAZ67_6003904 [Cordylochernes scorpioides]